MRVAVISDLHANRHALEAVAKDAMDAGATEFWCLGDVVGYGADPRDVLAWVEANARLIVKGNHDQAVATGDMAWFNDSASAAARFHAQLLDPNERARIYSWPLELEHDVDGTRVLLVHASPDDPLREYVFPTDAPRQLARWEGAARVILLGHTHVPFVALRSRADDPHPPGMNGSWNTQGFAEITRIEGGPAPLIIVNPGSVGQPRDLDPRASYALIDFGARTVELRRVAYDVEAAAQAIQRAGLPTALALRLYRGR